MTTDKRKDAILAKHIADRFLNAILTRKRGDHLFPWREFAAASCRDTRIQPYLPRFIGCVVRGAKTVATQGGRPSVVRVEVALRTGKKYEVIGELTVVREKGEFGVHPYRWNVLRIERSE